MVQNSSKTLKNSESTNLLIVISDPVPAGLVEYAYLRQKEEDPISFSSPIRFLSYQRALILKTDKTGALVKSSTEGFGFMSLQVAKGISGRQE